MTSPFPSFRPPRIRRPSERRISQNGRQTTSRQPRHSSTQHYSTQFSSARREVLLPGEGGRSRKGERAVRRPVPSSAQGKRRSISASQLSPAQSRSRMIMVWGVLLLGTLLLTLNLFRIQVLQGGVLKELAKAQQMIYLNPMVPRRPIVDRVGTVLAIDQPVYTLYAHPVIFQKNKYEIAEAITPILHQSAIDLSAEEIVKRFEEGESGIRIIDGLTEDITRQITALQLDGLELVQEQQRLYPQQDLFASVVGYVNVDREGQSGVEYSLEGRLRQPVEGMALSRSGDGTIIPVGLPNNFLQQQEDDLRLQLTLDSRLQRAARLALQQQLDKYGAKRGAVIVMDVHDGSIRSLVSEPSYDPNTYYEASMEQLRNWVLTDLYEPGSTFKPINVAIALQAGTVHPDDTFFDEGAIEVGGWPIHNSDFEETGGRGQLSVAEIIQYSSNVGMVRIMQTLEPGVYYGWLSRLQLDKATGIDLPSEMGGQMKSYSQFTNAIIEPATTAFGQGFSLTPIKLIQLHSMLANGGKMVTPHVVQGLVNDRGEITWQPERRIPNQIFSPQTTQAVLGMMEQAVLKGTGQSAQIPGYRIAGKTGTAQKASPDGGYTNDRITSFIGIFPIEAPKYAVLTVVDEPQGEDAYGSTVAAPVVKAVMEALISLERIPPAKSIEADEQTTEDRRGLPGNYIPQPSDETEDSDSQGYGSEYESEPIPDQPEEYSEESYPTYPEVYPPADEYSDEYSSEEYPVPDSSASDYSEAGTTDF